MPNYVTKEHFDATMSSFRSKFVTNERFDAAINSLREEFVTKDIFHTRMDEMMVILQRLDQERVFTAEWIRRIEADVSMVKKHLKLT